jgi:hypothetical protein
MLVPGARPIWIALVMALFVAPSSARAQLMTIPCLDRSGNSVPDSRGANAKPKRGTDPDVAAQRRAIDEARRLVGSPSSCEVVIIDPDLAADPDAIRKLDAFTVRESTGALRQKIFINSESGILREAARGEGFYVAVLAAVLVHEIEHLKGGSEDAARLAERRFFDDLIASGVVSESEGLRYAAVLRAHRADGHTSR